MQRWLYLLIVMSLIAVGGCNIQSDQQDGFTVMFDRMPNIINENSVYYNGIKVGSIHSRAVGAGNVTKIMISLEDDFARNAGDNIAFYPRHGRLEIVKLMAFGRPLQKGVLLNGFSSRADLNWFKFKTLISDRIAAARYRARNLHDLFGPS